MFKPVDSQQSMPELEEEILKFWDENQIFAKTITNRENSPLYSFYDGPPFATGTPHYGHLVASTMKDVVPRFWTMKGKKVERKWGWDCHGLPIENIAEKELGIKQKKEIEKMGVAKFNEVCRSKVLEYVSEWEKTIRRLGRWADMKNAYRTMDLSYMESIWWVFKELWDRGLVYESYQSMHICPRCETTLSQSEVAEGYKNIKDLSLIAKFKLVDEPETAVLAWTTTPWTLIANTALAVGKNIDYVKIKTKDTNEFYVLAKDRLEVIKEPYELIESFKGEKIIGKKYTPLFSFYAENPQTSNRENGWKIYDAPFVTTEEGTGVVHVAPSFGEDDMNLAKDKNLPFIQHVRMDGTIYPEAGEFAGLNVKPAEDVQKTDVQVIKNLASRDLLYSKEQYEHSYPHCWRCETPLLNYATSSWFVEISKFKDEMIELAKKINWSPSHIKDGRFGKWLEGAHDWSISRQRYWATCIPLWRCRCGEIKVIGSVKELEDLSGQKITDIHKDKIDPIFLTCPKCSGEMRRVSDVLDTWFDSGSMPYAQLHYPFENQEKFEQVFPAEFIAEGVDQTRAWFYYLHTIGIAIKKSPAFKNVIVNGIVLAEDGKKMSKRLQNYPDPSAVLNKYGADSLRFYLLTSAVMQAENLNFTQKDLATLSQGMFRMLWNAYSFFILYANTEKWETSKSCSSQNILDRWIIAELNLLTKSVNELMEKYDLTKSSRAFIEFIDKLSNWYVRRSRQRFKSPDVAQKNEALSTLHLVLTQLAQLLAPFAPFMSEEIYKNLTGEESVHLSDYPETKEEEIDRELIIKMSEIRSLVEQGLSLRAASKIRVRQPLASASLKNNCQKDFQEIIKEELNVKEIIIDSKLEKEINLDTNLTAALQEEGELRDVIRAIQDLRKKNNLNPADQVDLFYTSQYQFLSILEKYQDQIRAETNLSIIKKAESGSGDLWLGEK